MRVLLVDDTLPLRRGLAAFLRNAGHDVVEADHGAQAIEALQSSLFDVVISDVEMPEMDGLQLLAAISALWPRLPVFLMSGVAAFEDEARAAGARDFWKKPFPPSVLLAALGQLAS